MSGCVSTLQAQNQKKMERDYATACGHVVYHCTYVPYILSFVSIRYFCLFHSPKPPNRYKYRAHS